MVVCMANKNTIHRNTTTVSNVERQDHTCFYFYFQDFMCQTQTSCKSRVVLLSSYAHIQKEELQLIISLAPALDQKHNAAAHTRTHAHSYRDDACMRSVCVCLSGTITARAHLTLLGSPSAGMCGDILNWPHGKRALHVVCCYAYAAQCANVRARKLLIIPRER